MRSNYEKTAYTFYVLCLYFCDGSCDLKELNSGKTDSKKEVAKLYELSNETDGQIVIGEKSASIEMYYEGHFDMNMEGTEEIDKETLDIMGLYGSVVIDSSHTLNGTYSISDDGKTVILKAEKVTQQSKITGSVMEEYGLTRRANINKLHDEGLIDENDYQSQIGMLNGKVIDVTYMFTDDIIIEIDEGSMTFTHKVTKVEEETEESDTTAVTEEN